MIPINNTDLLLPAVILSATAFILSVLILILFKKRKFLYKGVKLTVFDFVVVVMGLSVFGMGVCGGYILSKTLFPYGIPIKENINDISSNNDVALEDNLTEENKNLEFDYGEDSLLLYEKPDDDAKVVYEIKEDLDMEIIDQAAGWYRIILDSGVHGWVRIKDIQRVSGN